MFTGLVEGVGHVRAIERGTADLLLTIEVPRALVDDGGCRIGDSIAINGCCLTVVVAADAAWTFQAGSETLSKTTLGLLKTGSPVNLERALPANGRLGGHLVQGHVDGTGTVREIRRAENWVDMSFSLPNSLARQMVAKGSIAVDGVSLTVVEAGEDFFSVALIPHTLENTILGTLRMGDTVNLETDILGKYVQRLLTPPGGSGPAA